MTTNHDPVDLILKQWANERPELDSSGFAVVGRILLLEKLLESRLYQGRCRSAVDGLVETGHKLCRLHGLPPRWGLRWLSPDSVLT